MKRCFAGASIGAERTRDGNASPRVCAPYEEGALRAVRSRRAPAGPISRRGRSGALLIATCLFVAGCTALVGVDEDYHLATSAGGGGSGAGGGTTSGGSGGVVCVPVEDPFSKHVDYLTAGDPYGVVAADFDADGELDLAVSAFGSGAGHVVSVLPGRGQGTFGPKRDFAVGYGPIAIAAGDVDKDGDIDVATANFSTDDATVLFNDGAGLFDGRNDHAVGDNPYAVALVDMDSDDDLDMIVANNQSTFLSVYRNHGDGSFEPTTDPEVGFLTSAFAAADITGDGKPDLLAAYDQAPTGFVRAVFNNGDGTFTAQASYEIGADPRWIAAADLDSDGDVDLVTANGKGQTVSVLFNYGSGTFAPKVDYDTLEYPSSIAAADLDGDGALDLAVVNAVSNMIRFFHNTGDGTFVLAGDYPSVMSGPATLTAADLNGDGSQDLAITNQGDNSVSVMLNTCFP